MTTEQIKLQKKLTALNSIRKIYNPTNYNLGIGLRNNSWDESFTEQRDELVKRIIDQLEEELTDLKQQNKK